MKIDPNKTWKKVEERLAVETDPILARNLQVVLNHMKAEAKLDLDGLIDTLSDDVHYHASTGRDRWAPREGTLCGSSTRTSRRPALTSASSTSTDSS